MDTKNFWQSKTVWLNILISLSGILMLVADVLTKDPNLTVPGLLTLLAGCVGIVIRVFFTNTAINH